MISLKVSSVSLNNGKTEIFGSGAKVILPGSLDILPGDLVYRRDSDGYVFVVTIPLDPETLEYIFQDTFPNRAYTEEIREMIDDHYTKMITKIPIPSPSGIKFQAWIHFISNVIQVFHYRTWKINGMTDSERDLLPTMFSVRNKFNPWRNPVFNENIVALLSEYFKHETTEQDYWNWKAARNIALNTLDRNRDTFTPLNDEDLEPWGITSDGHIDAVKRRQNFVLDFITMKLSEPVEEVFVKFDGVLLSENQVAAVRGCLSHPISILRGKAGTGKTLVIKEICKNLGDRSVLLTSFTGKAVSRLREVVGTHILSRTMHYMITQTGNHFDYVIIDETSMVSTGLFAKFISCVNPGKIIFVGDENQLEPIEWGCFFKQMIKSNVIPTYTLDRIYRSEDTTIAEKILNDPDFKISSTGFVFDFSDFTFEDCVLNFYDSNPDGMIITPTNDVRKEVNRIVCESKRDPLKKSIVDGLRTFEIGDRVILNQNLTDNTFVNGDVGKVVVVDEVKRRIQVAFPTGDKFFTSGRRNRTDPSMTLLEHAYAITPEKSQGSEYSRVFIVTDRYGHGNGWKLMNKFRMYVSWTRAKQKCWILTASIRGLDERSRSIPRERYDKLSSFIAVKGSRGK